MKYHVGGWATLFVTTGWVPKVNLLHFGRLQGSTQAFFATNWQDKPGICYRMGIYVSRKRIVSGPSARQCPLQDGRTLNEIFTSIHPNSDSSDVVPRMLCLFFSSLHPSPVCLSSTLLFSVQRLGDPRDLQSSGAKPKAHRHPMRTD